MLANGFGVVEQVLMLKSKNQALLQFAELTPSISFMQYYSTVQANIRYSKEWIYTIDQLIYCCFSN